MGIFYDGSKLQKNSNEFMLMFKNDVLNEVLDADIPIPRDANNASNGEKTYILVRDQFSGRAGQIINHWASIKVFNKKYGVTIYLENEYSGVVSLGAKGDGKFEDSVKQGGRFFVDNIQTIREIWINHNNLEYQEQLVRFLESRVIEKNFYTKNSSLDSSLLGRFKSIDRRYK